MSTANRFGDVMAKKLEPHSHPAHRNIPEPAFEPMREDDKSEAAERSRRWMKELDETETE
jgi:hypothetical protein